MEGMAGWLAGWLAGNRDLALVRGGLGDLYCGPVDSAVEGVYRLLPSSDQSIHSRGSGSRCPALSSESGSPPPFLAI